MLKQENSLLLVIDIQEKLVGMLEKDDCAKNAQKLLSAASILKIPALVSEQYPKGLGSTLEEVKNAYPEALYVEKTSFSAILTEEINNFIKESGKKQIILCGIETHICVLQTALDLIDKGFEVFVVQDACGSRKKDNFINAIKRLRHSGAIISDLEITLFELLRSSRHPGFKEVQKLIK